MKFDQLMYFLNNLHKVDFFDSHKLKDLKVRSREFYVSKEMLVSLEKEYYLVR